MMSSGISICTGRGLAPEKRAKARATTLASSSGRVTVWLKAGDLADELALVLAAHAAGLRRSRSGPGR